MKNLYIFAGPNGSGKSTSTRCFYSSRDPKKIPMINADWIARHQFDFIEDYTERNLLAAEYAERLRYEYLSQGRTFAYETVFSTPRHLDFMQKAKEEDYFISTYYISTESADVNIQRVARRVEEGGHEVPEDKIRTRYNRCMQLLPQVIEKSDFFVLFDNTLKYELVILKHKGKHYMVVGNSRIQLPKEIEKLDLQIVSLEDIKNLAPDELKGFEELLTESENENE